MKNISETFEEHEMNSSAVIEWCNNMYDTYFSQYFDSERALYRRLKDESRPITDAELEDILTTLPLQLFAASETLSQLKVRSEVVKLDIKDKLYNVEKASTAASVAARKEEAAYSILADQVLQIAFVNLIDRVEKEISYSKEMIMTAKKLWEARRATEQVVPTSAELPEYKVEPKKSYIKGDTTL